jgi:hypothetical protein
MEKFFFIAFYPRCNFSSPFSKKQLLFFLGISLQGVTYKELQEADALAS